MAPVSGPHLEEAISDLFADIKTQKEELTDDEMWLNKTFQILDDCEESAKPGLSLRQTAVYAYLCLKWSWFADCDWQQEEMNMLDAAGALRRANFICSECPLSPKSVKAVLEMITGRTFEECGLDAAPAGDAQQMYDDSVAKLTCLLQDLQNGVNVDYSALDSAITSAMSGANAQDAEVLKSVVQQCMDNKKTEDFIKCWAGVGVLDCASYEANQVADVYPNQCKISLNP